MHTATRHPSTTWAGIALIVIPLLGVGIKFVFYPGWMLIAMVLTGIILLLAVGYTLQVVLAARSMLRPAGVFNRMPGSRRGIAAAWVTSVAFFVTMASLIDGGDGGETGSAITWLFGNAAWASDLSGALTVIAALACIASWVWLMIEWIVLSSRARTLAAQRAGSL